MLPRPTLADRPRRALTLVALGFGLFTQFCAVACSKPSAPEPAPSAAAPSATPAGSADESDLAQPVQAAEQLDPAVWKPSAAAASGAPPGASAGRAELKAFIAAHPRHPELARLSQQHDDLLAPCRPPELPAAASWPHRVASCNPEQVLVAEGVLERAERYLAECMLCKDAFMVKALRTRMRSVAPAARREIALHRLDVGLANRDVDAAQQAIADHAYLGDAFLNYATRKLKRRFSAAELGGDLGDPRCSIPVPSGSGTAVFFSPSQPQANQAFRVVVVSEADLAARSAQPLKLSLETSAGAPAQISLLKQGGGPPYYWLGEARVEQGRYRVKLSQAQAAAAGGSARAGRAPLCQRFVVKSTVAPRRQPEAELWHASTGWNRDYENLYSAWISVLFDAPEATTWHSFHSLTRERARNFLYDHLGVDEDRDVGPNALSMTPDCADGPHFFRAYFAWKLGLPFGYHRCRFGSISGAPKCADWTTQRGVEVPEPKPGEDTPRPKAGTAGQGPAQALDAGAAVALEAGAAEAGAPSDPPSKPRSVPFMTLTEPREPPAREMTRFLALVKNEINARSLRTDYADDDTDLYPVPLTREALRPGSVYSDPYGHTYTLVSWRPQTKTDAGVLLAVDAQPDETINIKRFWRGNFLFSPIGKIDGHGFKAFRPIVVDISREGKAQLELLSNWQIALAHGYQNYSTEQDQLDAAGFYGRMESLINPEPLSPVLAYKELHRALHRQFKQRVKEIELGREYMARNPGEVIEMPRGQAIFRTTGPWEALSTPCRDLRLLVGIDALRDFPAQVIRVAPQPEKLKAHLEQLHQRWSLERSIRYTRSDGQPVELNLLELLGRATQLELGWNPNDCPEVRWGAAANSAESKSCSARAPEEQQKRMQAFRHWFARRYSCG